MGCYHGHADQFLVQAGSGVITLGLADSPGVPQATAAATLTATYNDLDSVRAIFEANKGEIAGVILEPVVGNSGFIVPTQEFLDGLRQITKEVRPSSRVLSLTVYRHLAMLPGVPHMWGSQKARR